MQSRFFPLALGTAVLLLSACANHVSKSVPMHDYSCESGAEIRASYPDADSAMVEYQGRSHSMKTLVSASGARYADAALEWWTKGSGPGSTGTLFRHQADGRTGETLELCSAR